MTKERECEGDIFETQRTILVPQKNGTEKKEGVLPPLPGSCKLFLRITMYSASVPCCRCRFATFFFSVKKESLNDRNTVFFDLWSNFTSICLFKYSDLVIFFFGLLDSSFVAISSFVPISSFVATSSSEPSPVIMKPAELLRSPPPCSAWLCILSDALVAAEKSQ